MAFVDLNSRKIYGANKGTLKYEHEKGHLEFLKYKYGALIRQIQDLSVKTLIFFTAFTAIHPNIFLKWFLILLIVISIAVEIFEEFWCWEYAISKLEERKEGVKRIKKRQI